ncbi:MAG TPA: class I SAM-dependent methyltransferase [Ktedonobacterales bacterium]|nr:class I SAM-dependent methyltransferase [Ktedonobacterales bacterium]
MTAPDDPYAAIAAWYDVEHDALTEDIECFASLLAPAPGGHAFVLEIGAGTGRIAAALAVAGHSITAIEPSAAMRERFSRRLTQIPERAARRVTLLPGTAEAPGLAADQRFGTVLLSQNLLAHLLTPDERHAALTAAFAALRPGGRLLADVDLLGPRRLLESAHQLWLQGVWNLPSGEQLEHLVAGAPGTQPSTVELTHLYDVHAPGGPLRRTTTRMMLAVLSKGEVEVALLRAGFGVEAIHGNYDLAPYDDTSPRAIFDARRPIVV